MSVEWLMQKVPALPTDCFRASDRQLPIEERRSPAVEVNDRTWSTADTAHPNI
jgi:hypothetical protein